MRLLLSLSLLVVLSACGKSTNGPMDSGVMAIMDAEPLDCGALCCPLNIGAKPCQCGKTGGPMPQSCGCPTSCTDPGQWQIMNDPNTGCLTAYPDPAQPVCDPDAGGVD